LLLGLIVGAGGAVFLLGAPPAKSIPGTIVKRPDPSGDPSGTLVLTLDQGFFDAVLGSLFSGLEAPTFHLGNSFSQQTERPIPVAFEGGCSNAITLLPEGSGVKTEVQFAGGKIAAPMAFSGSYNFAGNCIQFKGWAQTNIQLSFDQSQQTVYGHVNVEGVNLEGVSPIANNFVTVFVQSAIDQRVNPLVLVNDRQLSLMVPVKASNGMLKARVKDVRSEVIDGALKLHVTYEFTGEKGKVSG
jgi:hypothetical protein